MNNQDNDKKCIFCGKKIQKNSLNIFCNKTCKNEFLFIDYIFHPINQEKQEKQEKQENK